MDDRSFLDVWINCPDHDTAERIAEAAVGERLAACANIFAPVSSLYRWKGKVEREDEVPLLLKTRDSLFEELGARVRALHPYEVPAIVATALERIDPAYAAWLAAETKDA